MRSNRFLRSVDHSLALIVVIGRGNDRLQIERHYAGVVESLSHRARGRIGPRSRIEPHTARGPARGGGYFHHPFGREIGMNPGGDGQQSGHESKLVIQPDPAGPETSSNRPVR